MFAPSAKCENAAPSTAPLKSELPGVTATESACLSPTPPSPGVEDPDGVSLISSVFIKAATGTGTSGDGCGSFSSSITGQQAVLDHQRTASAPVSPAVRRDFEPSAQLPPKTPLPATASAATDSHADQSISSVHKKPRPAAVMHRSSGPSLLTQALASARGKPASLPLHHQTEARRPEQKFAGTLAQDSGWSNEPGPRVLVADVCTANPPSSREPASNPAHGVEAPPLASLELSGLIGAPSSSILQSEEDLILPRERGRSLERTDKEIRTQQLGPAGAGRYGILAESTLALGAVNEETTLTATDLNQSSDARREYRTWRAERQLSMGEKAWSIGTEDAIGSPAGPVEQSITEALAGVEPTRSRKASHSLRFFKEGLPGEKGKRKDNKEPRSAVSHGDRPTQSQLEGETQGDAERSTSRSTLRSPLGAQNQNRTPGKTAAHASSDITGHHADYFGPQKPANEAGDSAALPPPPKYSNAGTRVQRVGGEEPPLGASNTETKTRDVDGPSTSPTRREIGQLADEGDESGEEKISSAVFVPHQGPDIEDSSDASSLPTPMAPGRPQRSQRSSMKEDVNPWLVKAGEPEGESDTAREGNGEPPHQSGHDQQQPDSSRQLDDRLVVRGAGGETKAPDMPTVSSGKGLCPVSRYHDEDGVMHDASVGDEQPLEAIELIPYKHQVGGHTTLWKFSKRAVCKQLNNSENKFYENIERFHRDLLPFLPRYIGVLNVTFQKQARRRSLVKRDEPLVREKKAGDEDAQLDGTGDQPSSKMLPARALVEQESNEHRRVVSQSLASSQIPVPTVSFVDNQHIVPRSLLQPTPSSSSAHVRAKSTSDAIIASAARDKDAESGEKAVSPRRPALEERHAKSWGATTVNKRFRNEVFNDAFLKQPIAIHKYQRPASHQRRIPRRAAHPHQHPPLGPSSSEGRAMQAKDARPGTGTGTGTGVGVAQTAPSPLRHMHRPSRTQSDMGLGHGSAVDAVDAVDAMEAADAVDAADAVEALEAVAKVEEQGVKDVSGTSAPELDTLAEQFSTQQRKKRRYSGTGLRRKPDHVDGSRGDLKYFEDVDDVGHKADSGSEPVFHVWPDSIKDRTLTHETDQLEVTGHGEAAAGRGEGSLELPSPLTGPDERRICRPVNPKEAQTRQESHIKFFLLLEDLTAGMKRPCIMDLKMGTRQYGVEANGKKRESQRRKCAATTSRELGVRVCGLQTWNVKEQTYIFKDKYYGRDLKTGKEFQDALTLFLSNGLDKSSVLRHIPTILQKLKQLKETVRRLRGYRFYAASLLMFYDEDRLGEEGETVLDESTTDFATDTEETWEAKRRRPNKKVIDFKIADFANSVTPDDLHRELSCPPQFPNEPDGGFLRGLSSLKQYFLRIQEDVRKECGLVSHHRHARDRGGEDHSSDSDLGPVSD